MSLSKAVVPAAGLGTRFLPATLAVPKELLPLDRRPAIHHIVAEAAASGIDTVVLVLSRGKEAVAQYFLDNPLYAGRVKDPELLKLVEEVTMLREKVEIVVVYQEEPLGLGHAVLTARPAVGDEPFALFLPDDHFRPSPFAAMVDLHQQHGLGCLALMEIEPELARRYGVVSVASSAPPVYRLNGAVEKPRVEDAPSNLAIVGRYILPGKVFDYLQESGRGALDEIQLTDSLDRLAREEGMFGMKIEGQYLDLGTWEGYIAANVAVAGMEGTNA